MLSTLTITLKTGAGQAGSGHIKIFHINLAYFILFVFVVFEGFVVTDGSRVDDVIHPVIKYRVGVVVYKTEEPQI
jgi:hypothetical protein